MSTRHFRVRSANYILDNHHTFNPGIMVEIIDEVPKRASFNWRNRFGALSKIQSILVKMGIRHGLTDLLYWSVDVFDISCEVWDAQGGTRGHHYLGILNSFQHLTMVFAVVVPRR
jgi:hypothetical protein